MSFGGGDDEYGHADAGRRGTRTRLPENEGARPAPMRPGKSMLVVVGIVMLLVGAIAFATQSEEGDGSGASDDAKGGGQAEPTAPSGDKPVTGGDGDIPSGFAQSEQGAQSAAANYTVTLGGDGMYEAKQRSTIVKTVYAPKALEDGQDDIDEVYSDAAFLERIGLKKDGSAPAGMTFISRVNPVGTNVVGYSSKAAKVEVWYSSLFGLAGEDSDTPVTEAWYTNTFDLKWVDGDWKVADFEQEDGPAPVGRDQRASSAEEMADAVKRFGGFTYAR